MTDLSRRAFLGMGAASALLAPGVYLYAREPDEAVTGAVRWGMLVDTRACQEDCDACVTACNEEHHLQDLGRPQTDAQWIRKLTLRDRSSGRVVSMPMMCQHCAHPPCVDVCPTGASFRREDGIVLVDKHTCIGCRYCMMACPYKARSFIHENLDEQLPHAPRGKGCVESCTMCVHRIDEGQQDTACSEACTEAGHQAILFGDLNDPESTISCRIREFGATQVRADLGLDTGVRYQGI